MRPSLSTALYTTQWGEAHVGDSLDLLPLLAPDCIDLVITSPPFALQRKKEYGNENEGAHVEWLLRFAELIRRVLKPKGSFVLDLGGAYQSGRPVRSLYNFRVMLRLCDEHGFHLAEEFFWHNPAKLPSPIEWVNKRKIRAKDSVNTVWWFSKTENPKADVRRVLVPYSKRMQTLLQDAAAFYRPKKRPSGHDISTNFATDNGGAIPSNLLQIPNTESNSSYLRHCASLGVKPHPARFPEKLPSFFIEFLTDPGDTVLDIFAGSNTTGGAAEKFGRRWIAFEKHRSYLAASAFRFIDELPTKELAALWGRLHSDEQPVAVDRQQREMMLIDRTTPDPAKGRH
ncbi:MAG: site-specific DNA-methyltransferase [Verrucomicrobiales bacterium]|nr:site-specific DNA-methyltransferase [Verrucomicrobiales bacterium]